MSRNVGGGIGTRSSTGAIRRSHICAECGKSFRNGEDLFMHAEVCMLDAFEMEASAMHATAADKPDQNRNASPRIAYVTSGGDTIASAETTTGGRAAVAIATRKDPGGEVAVAEEGRLVGQELVDEDDYEADSDYEPPPELELAEPAAKKYKRVFPIGDDGKQIRPKMECPTCGLVLYRHNFSTHFRIHTGELPFQCSFCDKRFRTSSALTVHTRCHTGERPYECPHCNYCCITKRNLDRHIMNNHVRKSNRARGDYYVPRGAGVYGSGYYGDEFDETADDIDDENLEEAELEEEAGISNIAAEQRAQQSLPPTTDKNRDGAIASPTQPSGKSQDAVAAAPADKEDVGGDGKQPASYEPVYKRFASSAETVPILDGPKGVYGDPEADEDGNSRPGRQEGNEKTTQSVTTAEKEHEESPTAESTTKNPRKQAMSS